MLTRRQFLVVSNAAVLDSRGRAATVRERFPGPIRPRRADCFFGIHLDLHPQKTDTALGRDLTDEMVENFLAKVRPDFVQYDCKGHAGYMGYRSSVGTPSPGIVKDSLEIWRRVTARRGIGLLIHFSGVWDSLAVEQHPDWARVRPDGKPEPNQTSLFAPYVDRLMIPELKEAAERYDLDGAWVDGECWATNPDYSAAAARTFKEATGIEPLPKSSKDRGWLEFLEFNRRRFRQYVKHYVDALHEFRPKLQIASNWLYSTFVPEKPELPVDFLSGDYLGNASISTARLEARYMAQTGKPWDLMAWGFVSGRSKVVGPIHKPAAQIEQEASVVLAQGGAFQIYYTPTRAGWVADEHVSVMSRVAAFCRARQNVSHKSETVPQIGLLFSTHDLYTTTGKLFGGWGRWSDPARGMLDALIENQYSVDVLPEWKLAEVAASYPVIVVPDWRDIGVAIRDQLVEYASGGGNLVLAGADTAALFAEHTRVQHIGPPTLEPAYIPADEVFCDAGGVWQDFEPLPGAAVLLKRFPTYDGRRDARNAASLAPLGKGWVAAIYGPIGSVFALTHAPAARQVVRHLVEAVFKPMVRVSAPPTVEVVLRRKNGKLLLHLLNATAMQVADDYAVVDFIPPVGPIQIAMAVPERPPTVTLQPDGKPLRGAWQNGIWSGTVDRVDIHAIVAFG